MHRDVKDELRNHFQEPADAIFASIRDGKSSLLQSLLSASPVSHSPSPSPVPDLDRAHEKYGLPLQFAAWYGNIDAVELLLAAGANPLATSSGSTVVEGRPIDLAAKGGYRDIVKRLWSPASQETELGKCEATLTETVLALAAGNGHARIVEDLLAWDGWTDEQESAAFYCAVRGWHYDVVTVILKTQPFFPLYLYHKIRVVLDPKCWVRQNPRRSPDVYDYYNLERLIGRLADLLQADPSYEPYNLDHALHLATRNADYTVAVKVLLEKGASVDWQNRLGCTALHHLASRVPVGQWRNDRSIMNNVGIRLLLQWGASVTVPNKDGYSPLQLAAQEADLDSFRIFLSCSKDGDENELLLSTNAHQETLLHYAAAGCRLDNIEFLISQGLDVNATNSNGWTPLMCALAPKASLYHIRETAMTTPVEAVEAAQLLLAHGADPTIATYEGWTCLHVLALHCDLDIRGKIADLATWLIMHGIDPVGRAHLMTPVRTLTSVYFLPWGHRLSELIAKSRGRLVVLQPNLTPLHWAAQCGAVGVVKALLAAGVDVSLADANGRTAAAATVAASEAKSQPLIKDVAEAIINLLGAEG